MEIIRKNLDGGKGFKRISEKYVKHLFVINPAAGGKKNRLHETQGQIHALMSAGDAPYEVYVTKSPLDATDKIRAEAAGNTALRVYACGGDGTLNECAAGAAGLPHVAVTHYPCGTGNDFVKMFGPADAGRFKSLGALISGTPRPIDLIRCNNRYGINICSIGIDARIGTDVHKYSGIPIIGGASAYVVSLAVNLLRGIKRKFTVECGGVRLEDDFSLVCACNGRYYGGGFNPVPDARPDDGLLDFLIVRGVSRFKFLRIVGKYASGRYGELDDITHVRGETLRIRADREFVINIDGEALYADSVTFSAVPHGVNFIFPEGMEFFAGQDARSSDILSKSAI